MSIRSFFLTLLVLVMASSAVAPVHADRGTWVAPHLETGAADVAWRLVLHRSSPGACPDPAPLPWRGAPLFPRGTPSDLSRYCVYEYTGPGSVSPRDQADLRNFLDGLGFSYRLSPDQLALSPMSDPLVPAMDAYLIDRFLAEVEAGVLPRPIANGPPTRLAVVDSAPTEPATPHLRPDNANHGYVLANMARKLLCRTDGAFEAQCLAAVTARLALAYEVFDPFDPSRNVRNETYGGYFGTLTDLAVAIHGEVRDWLESGRPTQRLVLNLSLGWPAVFGDVAGAAGGQDAAPAQAVFDAVYDARCKGALVIAAAGNRAGGPNDLDRGALLPAAWERFEFDRKWCDDADPEAEQVLGPLVYAVGGVDADGRTLANARLGSEPPRVAFADHARVRTAVPAAPGETLTGSSVASLVVSSTAAAIWRYRPELSADEVMEIVDGVAPSVVAFDGPRHAETCLGCPDRIVPVRRVGLCSTVERVCDDTGASGDPACMGSPQCDVSQPREVDWRDFDNAATVVSFPELVKSYSAPTAVDPVCGDVLYLPFGMGSLDVVCPGRQLHGLRSMPWVGPQPETNICPSCCTQPLIANGGPAIPLVTLRVAVPTTVTQRLLAPTIATSEGVYRLRDALWPCADPGSICVIEDVPHDGTEAVAISFAIPDQDPLCDRDNAESCWSTTSYLLSVPY